MTRFVRIVVAALALTVVAAAPSTGRAQVIVNESTGTPVPLAFVTLNAGTTYYFTTAVTSPLVPGGATQNPVLTLMRDWNVQVAGAQFCGLFDFTRACFTYTPTTSGVYMLVLHGDNTLSPGRATVWQSRSAYCTNSTCSDPGAIGEIRIWNDVAFGGDTVTVNAPASGRVHYHTLPRPGNAIFHTLFARTTTAANFPERISRIAFNGWSGTGRIRGTVKFDTTNPTTFGIDGTREWVVGPSFPDQLGAVRLVRNHWFVSGADGDGDGISYQIEIDPAIKSCDLEWDATPAGSCSLLHPECASGAANLPICRKLLRDTDSDGLRDDLEIYGYDGVVDELLPMWGANPTHMDVFVELDAYDQDVSTTACEGFALPTATPSPGVVPVQRIGCTSHQSASCVGGGNHFFDRVQDIYGGAPARINPDGLPGISMHFDVGVANPNPLDTRFGNWGGGNTCLSRAPTDPDTIACPANPDDRFCDYWEAYDGVSGCGCPPEPRIRPERK